MAGTNAPRWNATWCWRKCSPPARRSALHWIADRQSGPLILRTVGDGRRRRRSCRASPRGECYVLHRHERAGCRLRPRLGPHPRASRSRAAIWSTAPRSGPVFAHMSHYMILFCRTGRRQSDRHGGVSQFLVDLQHTPGITIRPILALTGEHHFNEVVFQDAFLPESAAARQGGRRLAAGDQRTGLRAQRAGTVPVVVLPAGRTGPRARAAIRRTRAAIAIGRLTAHIMTLRRLSRSVAGMLQAGENPALQAALVKDLGRTAGTGNSRNRAAAGRRPSRIDGSTQAFAAMLAHTMLHAPSFSLRGGAREILRGIIARGLGLR